MVMALLFAMLYVVLILLYIMMKREGRLKRNLLFGVSIPENHREDKEIGGYIKEYKKKLRNITIVLAILPIPLIFFQSFTVMFTGFVIWVLVMIVATAYPFAAIHKKVYEWKVESQWEVSPLHKKEMVELHLEKMGVVRVLAIMLPFLLTIMALFVPVLYETDNEKMLLVMGALICIPNLIFVTLAFIQGKNLPERITREDEICLEFGEKKRNICLTYYSVSIFIVAILNWILMLYFSDVFSNSTVLLVVIFLGTIILCLLPIWAVWKVNTIRNQLMKNQIELDEEADSDANWIFGMFYYNKEDKKTMVDKRIGQGTTVNMARPGGKVLLTILVFTLLLLPACCVWVGFEEYTPISLSYYGNILRADHFLTSYEVKMKEVKEVSYIEELPAVSRKMGTGMDNLLSGTFTVDGYNDCELCLNPKNKGFIIIKTEKTTYIFSGKGNQDTDTIYKEISK